MSNVNILPSPNVPLLKCMVIDDESAAIHKLETFIKKTPGLEFVGSEKNPAKAQALLANEKNLPDVLFLDIEMKGPQGLKIAKQVMGRVLVVFTTGHRDFAADTYRFNAIDYLLKPIDYTLFLEAVKKCLEASANKRLKEMVPKIPLFYKDSLSGKVIQIEENDVLYLQSVGNYCKIHIRDGDHIMPHMSMAQILAQLSKENFLRIHKSHAVNLGHIQYYDGNGIVLLINDIFLEVGRTFKKSLKKRIR